MARDDGSLTHFESLDPSLPIRVVLGYLARALWGAKKDMGKSKGFLPDLMAQLWVDLALEHTSKNMSGWGLKEKGKQKMRGYKTRVCLHLAQSTTMWKASWGLFHGETQDTPTSSKFNFGWSQRGIFLVGQLDSFNLSRKKLDHLHFKYFLKEWMLIVLKACIDTITTQDHCHLPHLESRLAIESGRWLTIPLSRENGVSHVCSHNAHFVILCPQ